MFFISAKNAQNYKELMKNLVTRDEIENKIKIKNSTPRENNTNSRK